MSNELLFYVADTETTSLTPKAGEVSQITVLRHKDRVVLNKYIKIEHPEWVQEQALRATGRCWSDLEKGDPKEKVVEIVDNFFAQDGSDPEHRVIVGHNIIRFDSRFLQALWGKCNKEFPAYLFLDTLPWCKSTAAAKGIESKSFKLDTVLDLFQIQRVKGASHEASVDTKNNYLLFEKLKKEGVSYLPHMKRIVKES